MLVDRPQAGTSRLPSEVQLIVERKSLSSDFRGVNEVTYDDYDGLWSFKLCFHHGDNEDRLRREQLLKEAEVLKFITASTLPDTAMKPTDNGFQPAKSSFDNECLKVETSLQVLSVENEQHIQIKDVAVELVPGAPGAGPAVTVVVTTAPSHLDGA